MNKTIVIAVSAISGGGKTTFVKRAAEVLKAESIFFDDYFVEQNYPSDIDKWLKDGADLNSWKSPELVKDLATLKSGETIKHPKTGAEQQQNRFIIIEEPTGRQRQEMSELIDYVIVLDTPPAISVARRILRNITQVPVDRLNEAPKEALVAEYGRFLNHYTDYLTGYVSTTYDVYVNILNQVKNNCDLVIDWRLTTDQQVELMIKELKLIR